MKKYTYILFAIVVLLFSCEDKLEKYHGSYIPSEKVFTSVEQAQAALNGAYYDLSHYEYYGRTLYAFEASKGPDFFVADAGNRFELENGYNESSKSSGYGPESWTRIYKVIMQTNVIIDNIGLLESEPAEYHRIRGEAFALRAISYFDLMRLFAYPPIQSIPGGEHYEAIYAHGVPLILSILDGEIASNEGPLRNSAEEVYGQVVEDLEVAIAELSNESVTSSPGYVNLQAAQALLSRVYLYMGNWPKVIEHGLAAESLGGSMIDQESWNTSYFKDFTSESIWELTYSEVDNLGGNSLNAIVRNPTIDIPGDSLDGTIASTEGYAGYGCFDSFRELLRDYPEDVRNYLICDTKQGDSAGVRKYIGKGDFHAAHNIPIIRLPEVYLNLAEAYAEEDQLSSAETYLNYVVENRTDSSYSAEDKDLTIARILTERRKELVLEGHNYWDKFRRHETFTREVKGNVSVDDSVIDYLLPQVVYPIPLAEMNANENIRTQQNPGYAAYTED